MENSTYLLSGKVAAKSSPTFRILIKPGQMVFFGIMVQVGYVAVIIPNRDI